MSAVLALFRLRLRLLENRFRIGSRAGRVGMGLLRACAYLMGFAFLRFGAGVIAETGAGVRCPEFFFGVSLAAAAAIIFVVNLLVFAAEEFDVTDSTRDTAFLLSLPLTFRQVVWAKSLLRSTVDVYGVFLLGPLLWGLVRCWGGGIPLVAGALALFLAIELATILAAMSVFVWTARRLPYHRLETIRLLLGLVLPALASASMLFLRDSVRSGAIYAWEARWGELVAASPIGLGVASLLRWSQGAYAAAAMHAALAALGFAAFAFLCDRAFSLPPAAQARLQEGYGRTLVTGSASGLFARVRLPVALLVAKDSVLLVRRPVFLLTTVLIPLSITGIDLLSLVLRAQVGKTGREVEYLLHASVYVTLLILPFLGAAQSFGQTEHGRIGLLQALPLPMSDVMRAKVVLFAPLVVGSTLAIQLCGEIAFDRFEPARTAVNLAWTAVASTLATHVAVCAAALFPIFEFGVLAMRGANMAIGGMLHFTVAAAVGLLVFPLHFRNKLIVLSLTLPLVTYLWRKGAERLAYYDEGTTLARSRELEWEEAYILFGLYAALQVVVYVALLFVWDVPANRILQWSMDFGLLALVALAAASVYYLTEKGASARAALGLAPHAFRRALAPGVAAGLALALALPRLMALLGGGSGAFAGILKETRSLHLVGTIALMAVVIAPIAEELFFRGVLYCAGRRAFGRGFAALASGLLFALMHWDRTMPLMLLLALAQVALFERTGTLYAPMVAHAAFNACGLAAFALAHGAPAGVPLPVYLALVLAVLPAAFALAARRVASRVHADQAVASRTRA